MVHSLPWRMLTVRTSIPISLSVNFLSMTRQRRERAWVQGCDSNWKTGAVLRHFSFSFLFSFVFIHFNYPFFSILCIHISWFIFSCCNISLSVCLSIHLFVCPSVGPIIFQSVQPNPSCLDTFVNLVIILNSSMLFRSVIHSYLNVFLFVFISRSSMIEPSSILFTC